LRAWGALILAGGESRRLGTPNKALLSLGGQTLIGRVASQALKLCKTIVVSLALDADEEAFRKTLPAGVQFVRDEVKGLGPLEGLRQGMRKLERLGVEYALTLACDLPFLNVEALRFMLEEAERLRVEALIPRWPNGFTEPLHSVYQPKPMLQALEEAITAGESLIMEAVGRLSRISYLSVEELRRFDPQLLTLTNINTREDLERAKRMLRLGLAGG